METRLLSRLRGGYSKEHVEHRFTDKKGCRKIKQKLYILFGHYLISMATDYNLLTIETNAI